jgi:hypothetical protein
MHRFRPRLTYANIMASIAVFVALGGGAYAAVSASIPDRSGVIHGCYKKKNGNLRLTSSGRCSRRSERAIAFNQRGRAGAQGPRGVQGIKGLAGAPGAKGEQGSQGPGATSFQTTIASGGSSTLASLSNGVTVSGSCVAGVRVSIAGSGSDLQASGTGSFDGTLQAVDVSGGGTFTESGATNADLDVVAAAGAARLARIDVHGGVGTPCTFWGMATPSS